MKIYKLVRDIIISSASYIATCWILHWATIDCENSTQTMAVLTAFIILVTIIFAIGALYEKGYYND